MTENELMEGMDSVIASLRLSADVGGWSDDARKRWLKLTQIATEVRNIARESLGAQDITCQSCRHGQVGVVDVICQRRELRYLNDYNGIGHETIVPRSVSGKDFGCSAHESRTK